jgi:hypothetical protein
MTFDHRKPDGLDYQRDLPIAALTLNATLNPQAHYDDHNQTVIGIREFNSNAVHSGTQERLLEATSLSRWHHSETYSIFKPHGEQEEVFLDSREGTDKQFYGRAFHLEIPQHWRQH